MKSNIEQITRPCSCCRGSGRVPLSDYLVRTLEAFQNGEELSGADVHRLLGDDCGPTAINNRMTELEKFGLVTSRVNGRARLYRKAN